MNQAVAFRSPEPDLYPQADVRIQLLLEREPGYRTFFRNLGDLIFPPKEPPLFLASQPVLFPKPFYIRTGVRSGVVLQSFAWHLVVVPLLLTLWTWSSRWERQSFPLQHGALRHARLAYNSPAKFFPASEGRQGRDLAHNRKAAPRLPVIHLKAERKHSITPSPAVRISGAARSGMTSLKPALPALPLLARAQPEIAQSSRRRFTLSQQSVVAPPPAARGIRGERGITMPNAVVAPAPELQGSIGARGSGDIDIGASLIIPPPPRLPMKEQRAGWGVANGAFELSGSDVVPPSPSVNGAVSSRDGVGSSIVGMSILGTSMMGAKIILPPPLVTSSSNRIGTGGNAFSGSGVGVVALPPSVGHSSNLTGAGGSVAGDSRIQVVPPPPLVSQSQGFGSGRGGNALAGMDVRAATAQPATKGEDGNAENGGNGSSGASAEGASGTVESVETRAGNEDSRSTFASAETSTPSPSDPAATKITAQEQQVTPMVRAAVPPPVVDDPGGATRTLPLRVIQLALALPRTSYFTNYEAYLAERSVNDHETQLIKLVYIFLPYQRGLTEYGVSTSKKFKLRVTRDPSCDESLLNMTWREAEQTLGPSQAGNAEPDKNKLPCYRTTADDYRQALERAR